MQALFRHGYVAGRDHYGCERGDDLPHERFDFLRGTLAEASAEQVDEPGSGAPVAGGVDRRGRRSRSTRCAARTP